MTRTRTIFGTCSTKIAIDRSSYWRNLSEFVYIFGLKRNVYSLADFIRGQPSKSSFFRSIYSKKKKKRIKSTVNTRVDRDKKGRSRIRSRSIGHGSVADTFACFLLWNFVINDHHRRLVASNKEGRRFPRNDLAEAFSLYEAVESSAEFLRPAGLVKVNIYEDANHRHRSSRLVNQLRRRGFVFTPEGHPSSLSSTLRKHVHPEWQAPPPSPYQRVRDIFHGCF